MIDSQEEIQQTNNDVEQPPPFGKSWNGLYRLVIFNLLALIILFYLITIGLS